MKMLGMFAAGLLAFILETSVLRLPHIAPYAPNLVVFVIVMVGVLRGPGTALVFGLAFGLMQDVDYSSFLGETAFAYAVIAYLSGFLRGLVMRESLLLTVLLTGIGTEGFTWLAYAVARLFGQSLWSVHQVMIMSSQVSLSSMACAILLYVPFHRVFAVKPPAHYDSETDQP